MVNYQNAKIYRIESIQGGLVYYGCTCEPLARRMTIHRADYKRYLNGIPGRYTYSVRVFDFPDAKIYLEENYPCNSKEELNAREGWYIRNNECVNKSISGRTAQEYQKEYFLKNYDYITQRNAEYRETHREQQREWAKEKIKCVCGGTVSRTDLWKHKKTLQHIEGTKELNEILSRIPRPHELK